MTAILEELTRQSLNPIDLVERMAVRSEWSFRRDGDKEIIIEVPGHWCHYRLLATVHPDAGALLFACSFDMRIPDGKASPIHGLLAIINERLLIGHFELWSKDGMPVFRHAVLSREAGVDLETLEAIVEIALSECEQYYPAFQFVVWGGRKPDEALSMAILETVGEA